MQTGKTIFILFFTFTLHLASAQNPQHLLLQGDSLFAQKHFTQSFENYSKILEMGHYSPSLFLKMAFIQEGLNQPAQALTFLSRYHRLTLDAQALDKMESLAQKHNLLGYTPTDADRFRFFFSAHQASLRFALAFLALSLVGLTLYLKKRTGNIFLAPLIPSGLAIALLTILVNVPLAPTTGILSQTPAYIMEGPSSASPIVERASEGHQVNILGQTDVWVKIRWKGKVAFVKENNIDPVTLGI